MTAQSATTVNKMMTLNDQGHPETGPGEVSEPPRPTEARESTIRSEEKVCVWGVPFSPITRAETVEAIGDLIDRGKPRIVITANTHYIMLSDQNEDLRAINAEAALILADGAPPVWSSRLTGRPLPERVAGSDLIFDLAEASARKGHRLFLLGGAEGVAVEAARRLIERYPGLKIAGTECPPFRPPTSEEESALIDRIRAARPDILLVAFGQPKGERWILRYLERLEVPVCMQVGATLDFVAGKIRRAPRWMQKTGLEWAFRLSLEPKRLFMRYASNAWFIARMVVADLRRKVSRN